MRMSAGRRRWTAALATLVTALPLATAASAPPIDGLAAYADRQAARSAAERWTDPAASALDALGAYRVHPDQTTATALYGAVQAYRYLSRVLPARPGRVTAFATDAVDQLLFTFGWDGMLRSIDIASGQQVGLRPIGPVTAARYDPVGHAILVGDASGVVRSYPVDPAGQIGAARVQITLAAPVAGIGLSDGPTAVAVGTDGRAALFDVTTDAAARLVDAGPVDGVRAVSDILRAGDRDQVLLATAAHGIVALRLSPAGSAQITDAIRQEQIPGTIRQMVVAGSEPPDLVVSTTRGVYSVKLADPQCARCDDPELTPVTLTSDLASNAGAVYDHSGAPLVTVTPGGDAVVAAGRSGVAERLTGYVDRPDGPGADTPYSGAVDAITPLPGAGPYSDRHLIVATISGLLLDLNLDHARDTLASPRPSTVVSFLDAGTAVLADLNSDNAAQALYTTNLAAPPTRDPHLPDSLVRPDIMRYALPPSATGLPTSFFVDTEDASETLLVGGGAHHPGGGCVFVWDRRTGTLEHTLEAPATTGTMVTDVLVDPDLDLIIARTSGNHLLAWSSQSWQSVLDIPLDGPFDLRPDPSDASRLLATVATPGAGETSEVTIDLKAYRITDRRTSPHGALGRLPAGTPGTWIAVTANGTMYREDAGGHTIRPPIVSAHGDLVSLSVDPLGTRAAIAYADGTVAIVDLLGAPISYTIAYNAGRVRPLRVTWSKDGRYLAINSGRPASEVYRNAPGYLPARIDLLSVDPNQWIRSLCDIASPAIQAHHWDRRAPGSAPREAAPCPKSEER
jgi:hypothetical protein